MFLFLSFPIPVTLCFFLFFSSFAWSLFQLNKIPKHICYHQCYCLSFFFFLIWLCWVLVVACEIQFPDQGWNPGLSRTALGAWNLNHWTTGEISILFLIFSFKALFRVEGISVNHGLIFFLLGQCFPARLNAYTWANSSQGLFHSYYSSI